MSKIAALILVVIFAVIAVFPASAQGGHLPDDQQALVDRVLKAITATESYTSYLSDLTENSSNTMSIDIGGKTSTNEKTYTVQQTTRYTTDENDQPNISISATADVVEMPFGATEHAPYTLKADLRVVNGVLYAQAQRESPVESTLPPVPNDWVIVQKADDWPALDVLQLGDVLKNLDSPDIFDSYTHLLLQEASRAALTTATLDDGTAVDQITLTLTGEDLRRGVSALVTAKDPTPSTAVYYGGVDLDKSSWEVVFNLNAQDQIVKFTTDANIVWTNFDLHNVSPDTAPGTLVNQTYTLKGTYAISGINEQQGPVPAPEVKSKTN